MKWREILYYTPGYMGVHQCGIKTLQRIYVALFLRLKLHTNRENSKNILNFYYVHFKYYFQSHSAKSGFWSQTLHRVIIWHADRAVGIWWSFQRLYGRWSGGRRDSPISPGRSSAPGQDSGDKMRRGHPSGAVDYHTVSAVCCGPQIRR